MPPSDFTPLRDSLQPVVLPPNDQLEQLLLAALLTDNQRLADVGNLKPEHFGYASHGRLFAMLRHIIGQDLPATPASLAYMLNGEAPLVSQIAASAVTSTPHAVAHWAAELVALHYQRRALALANDVSRIFAETKEEHSYAPRLEAVFGEFEGLRRTWRNDAPEIGEQFVLSIDDWEQRAVADPDFLLGEFVSTTSRLMLIGRTGLGKTNLLMAMGMEISVGGDFLHWRGSGKPQKVLFIDGEMSERQFKRRLKDARTRCSIWPHTFFGFHHSHTNVPLFLDTAAGQQAVERRIEYLGGVDLIMFDNMNCLFTRDDSFGADSWAEAHAWRLDLTHRAIGQFWAHHTGHDETHGYGSKTLEWPLDTVIMMEKREDPSLVSFALNFTKARERSPENYRDFEPVTIFLEDDKWSSERGGDHKRTHRISPKGQAFLDALINALAKDGTERPESGNRPSVTQAAWQGECLNRGLLDESKPNSVRSLLGKYRLELVGANQIICNQGLVWMP